MEDAVLPYEIIWSDSMSGRVLFLCDAMQGRGERRGEEGWGEEGRREDNED